MNRMRRTLTLLGAGMAALIFAAPAAAAPTRPAQAFVDAFKAAEVEGRAAAAAVEPAFEKVEPCLRLAAKAPKKQFLDAFSLGLGAVAADAFVAPLLPVVTRLQAALDAIPTQDPVLRSARAAWRAQTAALTAYGPGKPRCDALIAWEAAGWKPSARPGMERLTGADEVSEQREQALERKLERAERRLRALGASKTDAARIDGDEVVDPAGERLTKLTDPFFEDGGPFNPDAVSARLSR